MIIIWGSKTTGPKNVRRRIATCEHCGRRSAAIKKLKAAP